MTEKNSYWAAVFCSLFLWVTLHIAGGAGIGISEADLAARGWLHRNRQPLDKAVRTDIDSLSAVSHEGQTLFYMVNLNPTGFIVVSADDRLEPVIAFSESGGFPRTPTARFMRLPCAILPIA
jgi:hypothetical protein